jgi:thiamine-monophosphate kinase
VTTDRRQEANLQLRDLGEAGLLARLFPRLPAGEHTLLGPGDDAAVVAAPDGRVVATTDVMVAGRDFRFDWSTPQDVGVKAAAQNLADVAAMGAVPTALLVALVAPPDLDASWATGLAEGLELGCRGTGAGVVGGDLSSGGELVVAITALGDLQGRAPVRRDGARPGQVVAVAGVLGRSGAGLSLLAAGGVPDGGVPDDDSLATLLVEAHRRPGPPYSAGPLAADEGATAMLDISDGLARDAGRIAAASGVVIDLSRDRLEPDAAFLAQPAASLGADPWDWVLGGGEDHGLLAVFAAEQDLPAPFRPIGHVAEPRAGAPAGTVLLDGREWTGRIGWDHFS